MTRVRAYEVTEKATVYRTYIVFARTREDAKHKVLAAENEPHPHNTFDEDAHLPRITDVRRAPGYDAEAARQEGEER